MGACPSSGEHTTDDGRVAEFVRRVVVTPVTGQAGWLVRLQGGQGYTPQTGPDFPTAGPESPTFPSKRREVKGGRDDVCCVARTGREGVVTPPKATACIGISLVSSKKSSTQKTDTLQGIGQVLRTRAMETVEGPAELSLASLYDLMRAQ
ncbi:hypothetical protein LZ31DRAFT_161926 [Colletotrichum somersetense]|nr:hypothetical protein LZ31DRAFT_161926 [Colletotrichum somersetense]